VQKNENCFAYRCGKNLEAVDEADTTLKQLKETYALKRAAGAAAVHIVEIQRDRAKAAMDYAQGKRGEKWWCIPDAGSGCLQHDLARRANGNGAGRRSGEAGRAFLQVVDPSPDGSAPEVNQVDFRNVHLGQRPRCIWMRIRGWRCGDARNSFPPLGHKRAISTNWYGRLRAVYRARAGRRLLPDLSAALESGFGFGKRE